MKLMKKKIEKATDINKYNFQNDLKYKFIFLKLIAVFYITDFISCDWKISQVLLTFYKLFTSSCVTLFYSLPLKCILHTHFQAQPTPSCKKSNSQNQLLESLLTHKQIKIVKSLVIQEIKNVFQLQQCQQNFIRQCLGFSKLIPSSSFFLNTNSA